MTEHTLHGPSDHPPGDSDNCQACILSLCKVCGGAEASLPTECPGERMTIFAEDNVEDGKLDYRRGEWWIVYEPGISAPLPKTEYHKGKIWRPYDADQSAALLKR